MSYISTVRKDGIIPSQLFLGRLIRTLLPILPHNYTLMGGDIIDKLKKKKEVALEKERLYRNKDRQYHLQPLSVGQQVFIQGQDDKWNRVGTIIAVRSSGSYIIESEGKTFIRARHFLKEVFDSSHLRAKSPDGTIPDNVTEPNNKYDRHTEDRKSTRLNSSHSSVSRMPSSA